jgi:CheY-like chemotaxis protein
MHDEWILQVEDDENDVLLLQRVFAQAGILNPVHVATDGQQAIDYLAGVGRYADRSKFPMPRLVLLDLKIPKIMGLEVLRWIRYQPALNALHVVVFSSSDHPSDVKAAHHLGANSYYVKPCTVAERLKIAQEMKHWFLQVDEETKLGRGRRDLGVMFNLSGRLRPASTHR